MKQIVMILALVLVAGNSSAFYNSEQGRWINRDPITDIGFPFSVFSRQTVRVRTSLPYSFVHNEPVNRWDYLGLSDGVDPCSLPDVNPDGDYGGVVCHKGKAYPCVWLSPDAASWYSDCVMKHEITHANDPDALPCDACKTHRQRVDKSKEKEVECRAYGATLSCLLGKLEEAGCDADTGPFSWDCMKYYATYRGERDKAKKKYDCSGDVFDQVLPDE